MNWYNKVRSAFQRLKSLPVAPQIKKWGVGLVEQLLRAVGFDEKLQPGSCGPRQVHVTEIYTSLLVVELRVPYCSDADLGLMRQALKILEDEAVAMTPVDTGKLKKSRYSNLQLEDGGKTVVGFYGYKVHEVYRTTSTGRTVFYALAVHNRDAYHGRDLYPNNPERASWKFLELAINNRHIRSQIQELFK